MDLVGAKPTMVGREDLLKHLEQAVLGPSLPGAAVAVIGESGVGKSAILDALAASAAAQGRWVLRGGGQEHSPVAPLSVFADMAGTIAEMCRGHPKLRNALAAIGVTGEVGPPWRVLSAPSRSGRVVTATPRAVVRATSPVDLLHAICRVHGPGLLLIDDCHLADVTSLQVLATVAANLRVAGDSQVPSLVCVFETLDLEEARLWPAETFQRCHVPALEPPAIADLLRQYGGEPQPELAGYVHAHTHGNPFEIQTLILALFEAGLVATDGKRLHFTTQTNSFLPSYPRRQGAQGWGVDHSRPDVFVKARVARLASETRTVLQQAAVIGQRFAASRLSAALSQQQLAVAEALSTACAGGLLDDIGGRGAQYRFRHARLRRALLSAASESDLQQCHARAAATALADKIPDTFTVSYHLRRAGQFASAVPHALDAAEVALDFGSLDIAQEHYTTAATGLEEATADPAIRHRIHLGLGLVHMLRGRYGTAERYLTAAHGEVITLDDEIATARVSIALEELAFKSGRFIDSGPWRAAAAEALGVHLPREGQSLRWSAAREVAMTLVSHVHRRPSRRAARRRRQSLIARLHNRVGYTWFFTSARTWPAWSMLRARRFAIKAGDQAEFAQAESSIAAFIAVFMPRARRLAVALARRAVRLRETPADAWGHAQSLHFLGLTLNAAGRYQEATVAFNEAWDSFEAVGDRWEAHAAQWQRAQCLFRLGRLREAADLARGTYEAASGIGDQISAGSALAVWARCRPDELTVQTLNAQLELTLDSHTRVMLMSARGWLLIHRGEYEEAASALAEVQAFRREHGVGGAFTAAVEVWRFQALWCWLSEIPAWHIRPRREVQRALSRQLRRCLRRSLGHPPERPEVLRALALCCMLRGRPWWAALALRRAVHHARSSGARGELAACLHTMRQLRVEDASAPVASDHHGDEVRVDRGFVEFAVPTSLAMMESADIKGQNRDLQPLDLDLTAASASLLSCESPTDVFRELELLTQRFVPGTLHAIHQIPLTDEGESPEGEQAIPTTSLRGDAAQDEEHVEVRVAITVAGVPRFEQVLWPLAGQAETVCQTASVLANTASAVLTRLEFETRTKARLMVVQERERGRVANDLHDEFGSKFSAVVADASALLTNMNIPPEQRHIVEDILAIAQDGVISLREVAWGLRPVGLDDLGLVRCLEQLVNNFRRRNRMDVEFMCSGLEQSPPLGPQVPTAVYRVVQEALTNIGRHSNARSASVFLNRTDERLRAIVEDDGCGFVVDHFSTSIGLLGMRERLQIVGGTLSVESCVGRGTTIVAEIPNP